MKNLATSIHASEGSGSEDWGTALRRFDRELRRRGAAERTRRAYGDDVGELAPWAGARGRAPGGVSSAVLRRYGMRLSSGGAAPATLARKLAAVRAFFRTLVEHGELGANPADLLPAPRLPQRLPATMKPAEVGELLDAIPASTPLELRDRAMYELAYACGLRAEEVVDLDLASVDFDGEQVRVEGKGGKTRFVPAGEPALRAVARYLERGRPRCSCRSRGAASPRRMCAAACGPGRAIPRPRARCIRTPCGTRSRRICS